MAGRLAGMLLRRIFALTVILEMLVLFHGAHLPVRGSGRPRCGGAAFRRAPQGEASVPRAKRNRHGPGAVVPLLHSKLRAPRWIALTGQTPSTWITHANSAPGRLHQFERARIRMTGGIRSIRSVTSPPRPAEIRRPEPPIPGARNKRRRRPGDHCHRTGPRSSCRKRQAGANGHGPRWRRTR